MAKKSNRDNPAVDMFYLEADEIETIKNNILNFRAEKLQTLREKKYLIYFALPCLFRKNTRYSLYA